MSEQHSSEPPKRIVVWVQHFADRQKLLPECPAFPSVKFEGGWRTSSKDLQKLIGHVAFAASTEESRPILNGVLWELRPERMRMVATNGHRLARMDVPTPPAGSSAQADLIVEGTFSCPSVFHHPIEPVMSIIADWTSDVIELWTPSNNAFDVVDVTAKLFGVQPEQVRVHVPFVGGNFGAKHWTREMSVAAALSSRVGRPVKYVAPEEEG